MPRILSLLCILWATVCHAVPPNQGESSEPTCAFLSANPSNVAGLTEAKLLESGCGRWLERREIDGILKEQELAASFTPSSPASRIALGSLLKADVLVLIRTDEERINLVVAETNGGLRILARSVPQSSDPEADSEKLTNLVTKAIAKYGETIREVYAVPPFLSRDLGTDNNHLMTAYAALVERVLLAQPRVLVVEIAEAEAIAREIALAAPGEHIQRRLPIYLFGEYRHNGHGNSQQVTITLQTKRGSSVLARTSHTLRPDEAVGYLSRTIPELVAGQDQSVPLFDNTREAQELAGRCRDFVKLRDWPQALTMAELSLLLLPDQVDMHMCAVLALSELGRSLGGVNSTNESEIVRLRRRRLDHLRRALAIDRENRVPPWTIRSCFGHFRTEPDPLAKYTPAFRKQLEIERDFALRMAYYYADHGAWQMSQAFLAGAVIKMLPERETDEKLAFLAKYQHSMDRFFKSWAILHTFQRGHDEIRRLRQTVLSWKDVDKELETLIREKNESEKQAYERIAVKEAERQRLARESANTPLSTELTYRIVDFTATNPFGPTPSVQPCLLRCLPLDDGSDVFWYPGGPVYHVTQPGQSTNLWTTVLTHQIQAKCEIASDGHFLWILRTPPDPDRVNLVVVEPGSARAWPIQESQGLPSVTPLKNEGRSLGVSLSLVPIRHGEAIVVGYNGDTWIAHVRLDSEQNPQVRVIHEAQEIHAHEPNAVQEGDHDNTWQNSRIAFLPRGVCLWTDPDSGRQWVIIERFIPDLFCTCFRIHPLLVDPQSLAVTVLQQEWHMLESAIIRKRYSPTQLQPRRIEGELHLMHCRRPDQPPVPLFAGIKDGYIVLDGDTVHLVGREWQRGSLKDGVWESLGETPWDTYENYTPGRKWQMWLDSVGRSNFYGIVAAFKGRNNLAPFGTVQILFDGSGLSFEEVCQQLQQRAAKKRY